MKTPWDPAGRGQDDMEALQTDVMRFMAILGLCLAAIFSLVRSPDFNPPPPEATEVREALTAEAPAVVPDAEVEASGAMVAPEPAPGTSEPESNEAETQQSPAEEDGFVLEFESAGSLGNLVDIGRVTLVVSDGSVYWAWSGEQGLAQVPIPTGYYAMEEHTVPNEYRLAAQARLGAVAKTWGVVLPADITDQIASLVDLHHGGVLVISSSGAVKLEKSP